MWNKLRRQLYRIYWFLENYRLLNKDSILLSVNKKANYNSDGLIVLNDCSCLEEAQFKKAYKKSLQVNDWRGISGEHSDMRWRYYIVCWFANHVKKLEGDFVECGVYKGGYTMAVMEYINFTQLEKRFWLFDTFDGLSFDHLTQNEKAAGLHIEYSHYENTYESVINNFHELPTTIIKGTVPETLTQFTSEKVCYLSIDMNCVEPEIAAVGYFWDLIVSGGVVILDDYGFKVHVEQKIAFDKFALKKNVQILQLPTGQGIIIKP